MLDLAAFLFMGLEGELERDLDLRLSFLYSLLTVSAGNCVLPRRI